MRKKIRLLHCLYAIIVFAFPGTPVSAKKLPPSIYISASTYDGSIHNEACSESTGYIHPYVSGGTPPYNFLWSNTATAQNIDNIPAGIYTITVTDAASSTATASWTITSGPLNFTFVAPPFYPCANQTGGAVVYHTFSDYFNGTPP